MTDTTAADGQYMVLDGDWLRRGMRVSAPITIERFQRVNEFLTAFSSYFPWIVALILVLVFKGPVIELLHALRDRMKALTKLTFDSKTGEVTLIADTEDAIAEARRQGTEVEVLGDPDQLKILFKAQGVDWKKSTKALEVPGGCLIQMTTDRLGRDGSWSTSEALQFVPGVLVRPGSNNAAHVLAPAQP